MKLVDQTTHNKENIQRLVYSITFFREVIDQQSPQFDQLMERSRILEVDSGETIIHKDDRDTFLYFLLKGRLLVLLDNDSPTDQAINEINPGELFGAVSMITKQQRNACIRAHPDSANNLLFAIDFNYFRDITHFGIFTQATKISFYRLIVHNIRWTLEQNKMREPQHPLVAKMRKISLFHGQRGSLEELQALHQQAQELAEILNEWNQAYELS